MLVFLLIQFVYSEILLLQRNSYDYINETEYVIDKNFQQCPNIFNGQILENTSVQEICNVKDLFYNINATIQEKYQLQMYIDLTNPWNWYKGENIKCINFEFMNTSIQISNISKPCTNDQFNQTLTINGENNNTLTYIIKSQNSSIQGLQRTANITIGSLNKEIKILEIERILYYQLYLADGAISFANILEDQQHNSILQNISNNYFKIILFQINSNSSIQLLEKPILSNNELINWINLSDTQFLWKFQINIISINDKQIFDSIVDYKLLGILSLTTQFIQLPKKIMEKLIKIITRNTKSVCNYIDSIHYALKCINLTQIQIDSLNINFEFNNYKISLKKVIRQCNINTNNYNDCIFNLKLSSSENVILGEPFFYDQQLYFNYNTSQFGFPVQKSIEQSQLVKQNKQSSSTLLLWTFGFTIILAILFLLLNIKHIIKWLVRAIKYRKAPSYNDEQVLRSKDLEFSEISAEQMTQSIEENSI